MEQRWWYRVSPEGRVTKMRLIRTRMIGSIAAVLLLFEMGCQRSTPQQPMPAIPLKVWVILNTQATDVFDESGFEENQGCRLSRQDITDYIQALRNNRHVYGPNFQFTWDETIEVVRSQFIPLDLPFQPTERRTNAGQAMQYLIMVQGKWRLLHINIYFAGWMTPDPSSDLMQNGLTIDPSQLGPQAANIVINDRGWNSSWGSLVVLPEHAFEHEMAHFLLRRGGVPPYDAGEHVPNGSDNILDEGAPHPLIVPTSEQQEIGSRILTGRWDDP